MTCLMRPRADLRELCEVLATDGEAWAERVTEALDRVIDGACGVSLQWVEHDDFVIQDIRFTGRGVASGYEAKPAEVHRVGPKMLRATFRPHAYRSTMELLKRFGTPAGREMVRRYGVGDIAGLSVAGDDRHALALAWQLPEVRHPSEHELRRLQHLFLHLEVAGRLRHTRSMSGTLSPDGEPLDVPMARADVWRGLCAGRLAVVAKGHAAARHLLVVQNPAWIRAARSLTAAEVAVLESSARGESGKQQAWRFGLAPTSVSRLLSSASNKLGLPTPLDAIRLVSGLTRAAAYVDGAMLTQAEREVLELVRTGMSNREVAAQRATSERTVANQVAALLHKTQQPSRRALAAARLASR